MSTAFGYLSRISFGNPADVDGPAVDAGPALDEDMSGALGLSYWQKLLPTQQGHLAIY